MAERFIKLDSLSGDGYDKVPIKDIRKQGGLKRDIVTLVRQMPVPDRQCETTDFLMALQYVLDKHLEDDDKKIDRSRTKQAIKKLKDNGK